jgi:hypothetical protein
LTSLDSWIVFSKRIGVLSPFVLLFLVKGMTTVLYGLIDKLKNSPGSSVKNKSILCSREQGPLGRQRRRWGDNIKMDLREIGWGGVNWIDLAQDRDQWRAIVNTVMTIWVP